MPEKSTDGGVPVSDEEVALKVRSVVAESLELDLQQVQLTDSLFALGAESLDLLDMAFALEKEYRIQFPRSDIIERAKPFFGEEELVREGVITETGLKLLAKGMPELDLSVLKPGLQAAQVAKMITVESFVRITLRLIQAKVGLSMVCPACGGRLEESEIMPELVCTACGEI